MSKELFDEINCKKVVNNYYSTMKYDIENYSPNPVYCRTLKQSVAINLYTYTNSVFKKHISIFLSGLRPYSVLEICFCYMKIQNKQYSRYKRSKASWLMRCVIFLNYSSIYLYNLLNLSLLNHFTYFFKILFLINVTK